MPSLDFAQQLDESNSLIGSYQPLLDMVQSASDSMTEALNGLPTAEGEVVQSADLFQVCSCAIENVAMAAEMVGFDAIHLLCSTMTQHLSSSAKETPVLTVAAAQTYHQWIDNVLTYLHQPGERVLAEPLVKLLPLEQHEDFLMLLTSPAELIPTDNDIDDETDAFDEVDTVLATDGEADGNWDVVTVVAVDDVSGEGDDSDMADFEASADESTIDSILIILKQELIELDEELTGLLEGMTTDDANNAAVESAIHQYVALVDRLAQTSEALDLVGLQHVCGFIAENINQVLSIDAVQRRALHDLFQGWPSCVLSYLNEPANEDVCLALISYLQSDKWPVRLGDAQARQLLSDLSQEIVAPGFIEEQEARETEASEDDVRLDIASDTNQALIEAFLQESPQFATEFSACVVAISNGVDVTDNIGTAQRIAHTLKGSANLIGIKGVANLTHHIEDILEFLSVQHQGAIPKTLVMTLQEAADCVETMIDAIQGKDEPPADAQRILQDILTWANRVDAKNFYEPVENTTTAPSLTASSADGQDRIEVDQTPLDKTAETHTIKDEVIRVPTRVIDDMFRMVGEMSIATSQIQEYLKRLAQQGEEIHSQDAAVQQRRFELEDMVDVRGFGSVQRKRRNPHDESDEFDSLEMDQYDELHGSIHAFIESVYDSHEMNQRIQQNLAGLDVMFLQQQRLNKELQQVVMASRMVPVNMVTARLQRSVRQACRVTGKQVDLVIDGADLLLDGEVLNKLTDPIMHMLRNAVDHGIEAAADRETANKNTIGTVTLKFSQDSNYIVVRCADDGRGLNYEGIYASAVSKGLINSQANMDKPDLARLILTPGFSTRDTTTQLSGRGVGMDVVNTTIQSLNGAMDIRDNDPQGCVVILRVPISLVTSHSIVVKADEALSAIPTNSLTRIVPPGVGAYDMIGDKWVFKLEDHVYPVKTLNALIGEQMMQTTLFDLSKPVLLTRVDDSVAAVVVDQILNSHDLIIKSTGRYVQSVRGITGVSILGDGSVVPVLDLQALLRIPNKAALETSLLSGSVDKSASKLNELPCVLVVDDSLSVRKALSQLIEDAGFKSIVARDGVEAMDVIRRQKTDLVLADMEMPRMTGLELTSNIRADAQLNQLPVIMITSRTTKKHRQQAVRAGVSQYMTKPFSEDELLQSMTSFLTV